MVGEGGADHAPEILPVIAQRPKLMERMDALVRVDDRRWDLRMKDGSLIQLPAVGEEESLMRLEQLDQRSRILELGFRAHRPAQPRRGGRQAPPSPSAQRAPRR